MLRDVIRVGWVDERWYLARVRRKQKIAELTNRIIQKTFNILVSGETDQSASAKKLAKHYHPPAVPPPKGYMRRKRLSLPAGKVTSSRVGWGFWVP